MSERTATTTRAFPPIAALGRRICVCGPSNTGKSSLAAALGRKLTLPVIHLDVLRHLPHTDWQMRPDDDFERLHDNAITADEWVIDGNYSMLMPQRLARATGIIVLGGNRWTNLMRYLRRTLFESGRQGQLDGAIDSVKWRMIHWITVVQPRRRAPFVAMLRASDLPRVETKSMRELRRLYGEWGLSIPKQQGGEPR